MRPSGRSPRSCATAPARNSKRASMPRSRWPPPAARTPTSRSSSTRRAPASPARPRLASRSLPGRSRSASRARSAPSVGGLASASSWPTRRTAVRSSPWATSRSNSSRRGREIAAFVLRRVREGSSGGRPRSVALALGAKGDTNLALKWTRRASSYKGKAAANLDLSLEPIRVSLKAAGKAFVGAVASLKAGGRRHGQARRHSEARRRREGAEADAKLGARRDLDAKLKAPRREGQGRRCRRPRRGLSQRRRRLLRPRSKLNKSASASAGSQGGRRARRLRQGSASERSSRKGRKA